MYGSGEVPHDELGPPWEFDDAGELWDVLWPLLPLALLTAVESVLDLDPGQLFVGLCTLLSGENIPENWLRSAELVCARFGML